MAFTSHTQSLRFLSVLSVSQTEKQTCVSHVINVTSGASVVRMVSVTTAQSLERRPGGTP